MGVSPTSAPVQSAPGRHVKYGRWGLLVLLSAADFLVLLDATVVNIALPEIREGLSLSAVDLQWVISAYILLFGATLLAWGRVGDLLGHASVFLAGVFVFTVTSLLCGTATSAAVLLGCRAVQGVGAAMVSVSALALVTKSFADENERTRALAIWSGLAAIGGAAGLILGGLVTSALSWRWIFLINVPIGVCVFLVGIRALPRLHQRSKGTSIDWRGAVLLTISLLALMYAVTQIPERGWSSPQVLYSGAAGFLLFALYAAGEHRSEAPLVPRVFLRRRRSITGIVGTLLNAAGLFGVFYFASIYGQQVLGYSAFEAGVSFLPVPVAIIAGSYSADRLVSLIGPTKTTLLGLFLSLVGVCWLTRLAADPAYLTVLLPGLIVVYVGIGMSYVTLTLAATSVEAGEEGMASGLLNAMSQIGGAVGLAIVVSVAASQTHTAFGDGADQVTALSEGFRSGLIICAAIVALAIVAVAVASPSEDWKVGADAGK